MKITTTIKAISLFLIFIIAENKVFAQADSAKIAAEWVKSRVWAKGLKIDVYPDINALEFYRQYHKMQAAWDKSFEFLADKAKLDTLKPGIYPIDGKNAYASITDDPEKKEETARWESHRKYIDLQYVIRGKEKIGVSPLDSATVTEPYNDAKDAAHYSAAGKYYIATPAEFYLFFPSEAHRPNLKVDGYDTVKKLVIKIKYNQ